MPRPKVASPAAGKRRAFFALFPGCEVLDATGPMQALHEAAAFGMPYEIIYCGVTTSVVTAQGLVFDKLVPLGDAGVGDRIFIPGYTIADTSVPARMVTWLRRAYENGAELCSVCTGAFAIGDAGLLDGRKCTTHWKRVTELQQRFPRAKVVGDRLFVADGRIMSSAGIASGIDMTLALLERDGGPVLASAVARELVVYMRRDGTQRQDTVYLDYQTHLSPGVHKVQQHLIAHPERRDTITELAHLADMSPRHLTRVFRGATGISIQDFRTRLRVERATMLMQNPTLTMERIASECGFQSARQLRRVMRTGA